MRISHLNKQRKTIGDQGKPIDIEFTGPLILSGDPVEGIDASNKKYVDTRFQFLNASDVKYGILSPSRLPAFSGDFTNVAGSNVFTLNPSGVTPGTYRKVTVDSKGRIIGSSALAASDIPPLDWSKIVRNKPNSLSGYGITDGIKLTGDSIVGGLKSNATPTDPMHAVTREYIENVNGGDGAVPPGVVVGYATDVTPNGYLRCNGGQVSKTMYPELYSVIGTRFGTDSMQGAGQPWRQQYDFNTEQNPDITGWVIEANLPVTLAYSHVIVTKNRVYLLGGHRASATPIATVYTAPINEDGTLGAWTDSGNNLPTPMSYGSVFVTKNRVHLMRGASNNYTAIINPDGTLGSWTTGNNLPNVATYAAPVVTKNRVYLLGGSGNTFYTAPINEDGTLGEWISSEGMPVALSYTQAIVTKNRAYLLGGGSGSSNVSTVYTAPINQDGTLGAWSNSGNDLPVAMTSFSSIVTKNRVYVLGGNTSTGSLNTVYTAPINEDGTLGSWSAGTRLLGSVYGSQVIVTKNRVYLLGGSAFAPGTTTYLRSIYAAPFSGGSNDYSDFYNGTLGVVSSPDKFRLPDYTLQETNEERFYIKY